MSLDLLSPIDSCQDQAAKCFRRPVNYYRPSLTRLIVDLLTATRSLLSLTLFNV